MGVLADAALAAGGDVIGVIPEALKAKEIGPRAASPSCASPSSMHERKALMAELADGFVALPGGLGTFEELCEILTWAQLGYHAKPVVILDVERVLRAALRPASTGPSSEGFVRPEHRALANRARTVGEVFELLDQPAALRRCRSGSDGTRPEPARGWRGGRRPCLGLIRMAHGCATMPSGLMIDQVVGLTW